MLYRTEQDCYAQKNPVHFKVKKQQTFRSVTTQLDIDEINLYHSHSETDDEDKKYELIV